MVLRGSNKKLCNFVANWILHILFLLIFKNASDCYTFCNSGDHRLDLDYENRDDHNLMRMIFKIMVITIEGYVEYVSNDNDS